MFQGEVVVGESSGKFGGQGMFGGHNTYFHQRIHSFHGHHPLPELLTRRTHSMTSITEAIMEITVPLAAKTHPPR